MLQMALETDGHEVVKANDGRQALEILEQSDIRMVISDWIMPGMNGIELCRQVRQRGFSDYIYLILLTSRNKTEDVIAGLSSGADDFAFKPFDPAELKVRVMVGQRILSLETRHVAIFAMAKLAESRDHDTGMHLERIREYSGVLARYLRNHGAYQDKLQNDYVEMIYETSPLHDIGKVGIPDSVLRKCGRLTEGEFDIMKKHAEIGSETLSAAVRHYPGIEYLRMARDIALSHHERFDGTGYPYGLYGEEIPLSARIVALADVYDALTSRRVYKEASTHEAARDIIVEESGTHFDPLIVEAFLNSEDKFVTIRERFSEDTRHGSFYGGGSNTTNSVLESATNLKKAA